MEHNEQKKILPLSIIPGKRPALLGHRWLRTLRLSREEVFFGNDGTTSPLKEISKKHSKVFNGELGGMKDIRVKLTVKPGSTPKCPNTRTVPYAIKPKVEAELDKLVKSGVLEPMSTSDWVAPVVPVRKKMGPEGSVMILKSL